MPAGIYVGGKQVIDVAVRNEYALQAWLGDKLLWERDSTPPPGWVPPASDLTNTCIVPALIGQVVTEENSAQGGDPWQTVSGGLWTYTADGIVADDTSQVALLQWDAAGIAAPADTLDTKQSVGFWLTMNSASVSGRIQDMRNASNTTTYCGLIAWTDGSIRAMQGTSNVPGSASPPLVVGQRYWVTYGCDNVAAGSHRLLIQHPDGFVFHDWTGTLTGTGDQIGFRRFGKVTTSAAGLTIATIKATSGVATGLPLEPA